MLVNERNSLFLTIYAFASIQGEWFWLPVPQDERAFIPAKKVQQFHDGRVELETEDGNVRDIKRLLPRTLYPLVSIPILTFVASFCSLQRFMITKKEFETMEQLLWVHLRRLEKDLVMLDVMNRPLIIHNLRNRYKNNEIYTNVGTILVSCNPYKKLPLYTPAVIDSYRRRGMLPFQRSTFG